MNIAAQAYRPSSTQSLEMSLSLIRRDPAPSACSQLLPVLVVVCGTNVTCNVLRKVVS